MIRLRYLLIILCLETASGAGNAVLEGSPFTARDTLVADLEP